MTDSLDGAGAAVVLLSGGLDSGVALALWVARGGVVSLCLFADYGQRAVVAEAAASQALADRFGCAWQRVDLRWLGVLATRQGCALTDAAVALPEGTCARPGDAASAQQVWVPARNLVFLAVAAAHAEAHGGGALVAGFNREEAATFSDNSTAFVAAVNQALDHATLLRVQVESPTTGMDKQAIVAAARQAGFKRDDFWSCYQGGAAPCGRCESCLRSEVAWRAGGG